MSKLMDAKVLLLMALSLLTACEKEVETPSSAPVVQTIHYRVSVRMDVDTKATLGVDMAYKYETGDRVYVESADGKLYGFLDLADENGVGSHETYFEGELTYEGTLPRNPETSISLVLVSATDALHTVSEGKVAAVTAGSYGQGTWASSLEDAVRRLSHFTGSGLLKDKSFTLQQQSSFLKCSVRMKPSQAPVNSVFTAKLLNNSATLREVSVKVTSAGKLPFVFAFLGGDVSLEDAKLVIDSENTDQLNYTVANQTLAANTYYSISRSALPSDLFRIEATKNNTTITFNYNYSDSGIEYSLDYGDNWIQYTQPFTLNKGDVACIKGNRSNYKNEKANDQWWNADDKPIFKASDLCYISGSVMSLLKDKENLSESAFQGAFSRGTTAVKYIDIDPDDPLVLPAKKLSYRCYMRMFHNCTSLTTAPVFTVEETAEKCCYNMFRKCSILADVSGIKLNAEELTVDCYREFFRECPALTKIPVLPAKTLVQECYRQMLSESGVTEVVCYAEEIPNGKNCLTEWMSKLVSETGTFYKVKGVTYPRNANGIPGNWTVVEVSE